MDSDQPENKDNIKYGWRCCVCRNVYSPFVTECGPCNTHKVVITTDSTITLDDLVYRGPDQNCALESYFKNNPKETSVNLYCGCPKCSPRY